MANEESNYHDGMIERDQAGSAFDTGSGTSEDEAKTNSENNFRAEYEELIEVLRYFLDGRVEEAISKMAPHFGQSILHSTGNTVILFLQALMTSDQVDIEKADRSLKITTDLCIKRRRRMTITNNFVTNIIMKPNYSDYTEEEAIAEMMLSSSLMIKSVLSFMQNDNIFSLIKSGLRIRTSFMLCKKCEEILEQRHWTDQVGKNNFKCGVMLGLGMHHLGLSGLPTTVLKLMKFAGMYANKHSFDYICPSNKIDKFTAKVDNAKIMERSSSVDFYNLKEIGLQALAKGQQFLDTLAGPLCLVLNLVYQVVFNFSYGSGKIDIENCKSILQPLQKAYPDGTLTLYFSSHIEAIQGNIEKATEMLLKSATSDDNWTQMKHLIYWELHWFYTFECQWHKSQQFMKIIQKDTCWSKTIASYLLASVMSMRKDLSEAEQEQVVELMRNAPNFLRRFAGKSLHMEKFVCKRVARFEAQNKWLFLPIIEAFYVYHYFLVARNSTGTLLAFLEIIERAIDDLVAEQSETIYFVDNFCLGLLLKGVCLRHLKKSLQAEECFRELLEKKKKIVEDNFLPAFALVELGFLHLECNRPFQATHYFDLAKEYKKISMESRLHLRIHAGLSEIKELNEQRKKKATLNH